MKLTPFRMHKGLPAGSDPQAKTARETAKDLISDLENYAERYSGNGSQTVSHGTEVDFKTLADKVHGDELVDNAPQRSKSLDGISAYNFHISSGVDYSYLRDGETEMFSRESYRDKLTVLRNHASGVIAVIEE